MPIQSELWTVVPSLHGFIILSPVTMNSCSSEIDFRLSLMEVLEASLLYI